MTRRAINRFIAEQAGVRLSDREIREEEFEGLAKNIDFRSFKPTEILDKIDSKIDRWSKLKNKILLISSVPLLLLILSVFGLELEITLIGIKLKYIEKAKEIIILLFFTSSVYYNNINAGIDDLKILRNQIFKRKYGQKQFETVSLIFTHDQPERNTMGFLFHPKYKVFGFKKLIEIIYALSLFVTVFVFISILGFIFYVLCIDLWNNSNYGNFTGKIIVGFIIVYSISDLFIVIFRENMSYTYIEKNKEEQFWEKYSKTDGVPDRLSEIIKELVQKNEIKKAYFWFIFSGICFVLFITSYFELI